MTTEVKADFNKLLQELGVTPEWELLNAKQTAIARMSIPKGKRDHAMRLLDEFVTILLNKNPA